MKPTQAEASITLDTSGKEVYRPAPTSLFTLPMSSLQYYYCDLSGQWIVLNERPKEKES